MPQHTVEVRSDGASFLEDNHLLLSTPSTAMHGWKSGDAVVPSGA